MDTVVLTIPQGKFRVTDPARFSPNANIAFSRGNYLVPCKNNPTAQHKKDGVYMPRLTLTKRPKRGGGSDAPLRVEFSAPKMKFGNNINELGNADFDDVVVRIYQKLSEMGVLTSKEFIADAPISALHIAKNIALKDGYTSSFVIKELNKANVSKRMDAHRVDFRDGRLLQYYTNSHALVIYDKKYDLKMPQKRAIDKDQNYLQRSIFEALEEQGIPKELLRIEARLQKKYKINALFKKLDIPINPTFRNVFDVDLWQKILLYYWETLIKNKNMFLFDMTSGAKKMLQNIKESNPDIKPKQAVYLTGLQQLCKDKGGIRELRAMVERSATSRTWYRMASEIDSLNEFSDKAYHDWVQQIENELRDFNPFELST